MQVHGDLDKICTWYKAHMVHPNLLGRLRSLCPANPFCLPMDGSTHFRMLEILSVHNEIGTYHFHEGREGRETFDAEDAALTDDFTESFGRKLCFIRNAMLHGTIMTLTAQVDPLPTTPVFSIPQVFCCHSDKRCPISKSFFTHPSKCYSSSFSITWPFLSAPAQFHLSAVSHLSRICVPTSCIPERSGILFGAVLPPFFHVHGWLFIQICCVLSRGRQRIIFKGG